MTVMFCVMYFRTLDQRTFKGTWSISLWQRLSFEGDREGPQEPPEDMGIVIKGVKVLHGLTSVASACALLLGLLLGAPENHHAA